MSSWLVLASACAAFVAPDTTTAIITQESGGNPLAVHVNGLKQQPRQPQNMQEAVQTATVFIMRGYSVDLGLMQVNSRNLPALGLRVADAFEPCANIHAGATVLAADYVEASKTTGPGRTALLAALSAYNTGNFYEGFLNGYVGRYTLIPAGLMQYAQEQESRHAPRYKRADNPDALVSPHHSPDGGVVRLAGKDNTVVFYQ
ncbi:lytic transglycosylase domain-containing protein [Acetobacter malorum]|uniref:lytic transglycosylase domain-containing protein n=1 Tax=Acetobacter malorum TaxID=178901 RepID=UPI0007780447|nr:lytic transglycosylase domain-containing protein [Acetobacter malorum]